MRASDLIDRLAEQGGKPVPAPPNTVRALKVGMLEVVELGNSTSRFMRARWRGRLSQSTPGLLIADDDNANDRVRVLGPTDHPGVIRSVSTQLLATSLLRAMPLDSPFHAARQIGRDLVRMGGDGLTVNGLLTRHTVEHRFCGDAARWELATKQTMHLRPMDRWDTVLEKLGFTLRSLPVRGHLAMSRGRAVAVVHPKKSPESLIRVDQQGRPPEGLLIRDCNDQGTPFGILAQGGRIRLFDARSPSATSRWLEMDTALLGRKRLPLLGLLAPNYLANDEFRQIQREARDFGLRLHRRLDQTIRQDALPALATGMQHWATGEGLDPEADPTREELRRAALTLVFRIVFILFCESAGHLPMDNGRYRDASLSTLIREASKARPTLGARSPGLWERFSRLVDAIRNGNPDWDVPAYNGALFAATDFDGAEMLEAMELRDPAFASVLLAIGQDRDGDGERGTDFSTLDIGHIGHTYESLLGLRLAVAGRPLRYDARADRYVGASGNTDPAITVRKGDLLWQSDKGGRKAGGAYYTPVEIVRFLVERSVLPAFERHLREVARRLKTDPSEAGRQLFRFAVVDPACGSAHFLVSVVEILAERTVRFLAEHPLPSVTDAMHRLRSKVSPGIEVDDVMLLRRLLVKHCVFGVDISRMGAEVATLSLWLASFVPGLSLAYLGRNVVVGNSLIGVTNPGTVVSKKSFFTDKVERHLDRATAMVGQVAESEDRTPLEVLASQTADRNAREKTVGLKSIFDLWTAEQFGLTGARQHVELHGGEIIEGGDWDGADLLQEATALSKRHQFLHWPLIFPRVFTRARPGFDVVVGNPPWEEIRIEELQFYGTWIPGLQGIPEQDRAAAISALTAERPELPLQLEDIRRAQETTRRALTQGDYEAMGGKADLYKYFCQRYRHLLRDGGYLGVVLPRTAFNTKGSRTFRRWLHERMTTRRIDFLVNQKGWAFADVTWKYTFALVVAQRKPVTSGHRIEIAGTAHSQESWRRQSQGPGVHLSTRSYGPGMETPMLRSQDEANVLDKLRDGPRFPLGPRGRWCCFPVIELTEGTDKRYWLHETTGKPLWRGASFGQYEPRGSDVRWCPDTPSLQKKINKPRPGTQSLVARHATLAMRREAVRFGLRSARIAFRDIARATDPRTVIACLIPPGVLVTDTAPYLAFVKGDTLAQAACLGVLNSLPFDWQARRYVEIHVNFFLLEGLHIPDLSDEDFSAIGEAAARLSVTDERFHNFRQTMDLPPPPPRKSKPKSVCACALTLMPAWPARGTLPSLTWEHYSKTSRPRP